jgi:glycosyltransferase involved in cell wall biosynthesis
LRICIDARNPFHGGGTYTYIVSLLEAMSELKTDHEILVLYDDTHEALGLPVFEERVVAGHNPLQMILWNRFKLGPLLDMEEIDLYHSLKQPSLPKTKARTIYTVHATNHYIYPQLWKKQDLIYWRWGTRATSRSSDALIAISKVEKQNLVHYLGMPPEKIHIIPLAPQPRFKPVTDPLVLDQARLKYALPEKFVLFVGNIYPFKNVINIVRAYHRAITQGNLPHKLVLAGGFGKGSKQVINLIKSLEIGDRVILPGFVKQELPALYTLADLFVFPSVYEAFGLPPLEAMSCGTPVIVSTAGALPEVVGDAAIHVDPYSVDEISAAILRVLCDDQLKQDLVSKGFKRSENFTYQDCARKTLSLYDHVLIAP